jgi:hypothetical protein
VDHKALPALDEGAGGRNVRPGPAPQDDLVRPSIGRSHAVSPTDAARQGQALALSASGEVLAGHGEDEGAAGGAVGANGVVWQLAFQAEARALRNPGAGTVQGFAPDLPASRGEGSESECGDAAHRLGGVAPAHEARAVIGDNPNTDVRGAEAAGIPPYSFADAPAERHPGTSLGWPGYLAGGEPGTRRR